VDGKAGQFHCFKWQYDPAFSPPTHDSGVCEDIAKRQIRAHAQNADDHEDHHSTTLQGQ
jgi:hypothetical protein